VDNLWINPAMMAVSLVWLSVLFVVTASVAFPPPFTRDLQSQMQGNDVFILQNLLNNPPFHSNLNASAVYDTATVLSVRQFQQQEGLNVDGIAGVLTQAAVLTKQGADGYRNTNETAAARGYLYKIVVPVHRNRSVETTAHLEAGNGTVLATFQVRAHGYNDCQCNDDWPNFNNTNV
jgi:peptidoglycan hydrolase-like protein with peptidoglycan-binding domain